MRSLKKISILLLLYAEVLQAQDLSPKYANEFLNMGVGATALGMGSAVVADISGLDAAYWNPAGLAIQKQSTEVGLMHASYFGGLAAFDHLGISHKIASENVVALNVIRLGVDNIYNTTQLIDNQGNIDYSQLETFNSADYALIGSLSRPTKIPNIFIGANSKLIFRHIGSFAKAFGFGFDFSAQYRPSKYWSAGLTLRDATSTFCAWSYQLSPEMQQTFLETNNELPKNGVEQMLPRLVGGIAAQRPFKEGKFLLGGQLNLELTTDGQRNTILSGNVFSLDPRAGLFLRYDEKLCLRTGVSQLQYYTDFNQLQKLSLQPHVGAGIVLQNWTIDYAFTRLGLGGEGYFTHIFSLKWAFSKSTN